MHRLWKTNVFLRFFIRLGVILVLVTLAGYSLVSWYFERENTKRVDAFMVQEVADFEQRLRGMDLENPAAFQRFSESIDALMRSRNILRLDVVEQTGKARFSTATGALGSHIAPLFQNLTPGTAQSVNFCLLPADRNDYILLLSKRLSRENVEGLTLKMAISMKPELVLAKRRGMTSIVFGTVVILFLVVLATFPIIYRQYRELQRGKMQLLHSNLDMIRVLGNAVALRDSDTNTHNYRVTYYTIRLAEALQLERGVCAGLIKGAFLHDVGKIGIPDAILLKPGKLGAEEFDRMRTHVRLGLEMLEGVPWLEDAKAVIGSHHERYDGSGYPQGIAGNAIPLAARIFAVADVFDALASRRPYKEPLPLQDCLVLLKEHAGTHLDPNVVHAFLQIADRVYAETCDANETELSRLLSDAVAPYLQAMIAEIRG
jgi:HD-GYP domain-containing protein (c-di-GMP phosphodiesterase class II)